MHRRHFLQLSALGALPASLGLTHSAFAQAKDATLPAAAGRDSPRQATSLFAQPKREAKNLPHIQRPRKLRVANLSGQPAVTANAGVRWNSFRA